MCPLKISILEEPYIAYKFTHVGLILLCTWFFVFLQKADDDPPPPPLCAYYRHTPHPTRYHRKAKGDRMLQRSPAAAFGEISCRAFMYFCFEV